MSLCEQILTIAIAAVTTMATRFLPFLVFRGKETLPPYFVKLGWFLPPAIRGALVMYCYRDLTWADPRNALISIGAGALTMAVHLWKGNMPLSIIVGTGSYMLLIHYL